MNPAQQVAALWRAAHRISHDPVGEPLAEAWTASFNAAVRDMCDTPAPRVIPPDDCCWRCDTAESQTEVGLCSPCHQSLTA